MNGVEVAREAPRDVMAHVRGCTAQKRGSLSGVLAIVDFGEEEGEPCGMLRRPDSPGGLSRRGWVRPGPDGAFSATWRS